MEKWHESNLCNKIMEQKSTKHEHTIDASGKSLGRVASEVAKALMGKMNSSYTPHHAPHTEVLVRHAKKLLISEKKRSIERVRYTGYPGGLRKETLGSYMTRRGVEEALRRAVKGMLPRNTLLVGRMKNLKIEE